MTKTLKGLIVIVLIGLSAAVFVYGASHHSSYVNTDFNKTDQNSYMNFSIKIHETNGSFTGVRNRMPLYPRIMSLFYSDGLSKQDYFNFGKQINIYASLSLLLIIYLLCRNKLNIGMSTLVLFVSGFSVFIFRAAYFHPEPLFYTLNFCIFLCFVNLFKKISWGVVSATGILIGMAYLTKASVLLSAFIGLGLLSIKLFVQVLFAKKFDKKLLIAIASIIIGFLIVAFPYLQESKVKYTKHFYNVNTTFAIWADTAEEYKLGPKSHGDRKGWPTMPKEDIPSFEKYINEHNVFDILFRLGKYGKGIVFECLTSYGYQFFILLSYIWIAVLGMVYKNDFKNMFVSHIWESSFILGYLVINFLACSWYGPIELGNRLILAHFLPLIFSLSWGIEYLMRNKQVRIRSRYYSVQTLFYLSHGILFIGVTPWIVGFLMNNYAGS